MAEEVRADLKDISNTVSHLLLLAREFAQKSLRYSRFWNNTPTRSMIHSTKKGELIRVAENLYIRLIEAYDILSEELTKVNDVGRCPSLKEYVTKIRSYQERLINEDLELLSNAKKVISKFENEIDLTDVKIMLRRHGETLKILKNLDTELAEIEKSERYKIENPLYVPQPSADVGCQSDNGPETIEIDMELFYEGTSKKLLKDLILTPTGVQSAHQDLRNLRGTLRNGKGDEYKKIANHIHKKTNEDIIYIDTKKIILKQKNIPT